MESPAQQELDLSQEIEERELARERRRRKKADSFSKEEDRLRPLSDIEREIERQREGSAPPSPRTFSADNSFMDRSAVVCSGCRRQIKGNCVYDEDNTTWHSECFQLRRQFEEDDVFEEDSDDEGMGFEDIEKIVMYWRDLYFRKSEECDYLLDEKDRLEEKIKEIMYDTSSKGSIYSTSSSSLVVEDQPSELAAVKDRNKKLEKELSDLSAEVQTLTLSRNDIALRLEQELKSSSESRELRLRLEHETRLESELSEFKSKYDDLLKTRRLELLEKDQEITQLEAANELLQAKLAKKQESEVSASETERERSQEFARLQAKVERIARLYEEQKQRENQELNELKKKYDELLATVNEEEPLKDQRSRALRSQSIEELSLFDLQGKYEELKNKYEAQLAQLKGTTLEKATSKRKLKKETSEEYTKKIKEAEAAIIREGPMQYKLLAGLDGKRSKAKEWTESWVVLNNDFLEIYPNREARFTKKRVKLDVTGGLVEYEKDTKRKKEAGAVLRFTTPFHGSYLFLLPTLEDAEEWQRVLQHVCEMNQSSVESLAALARRSHCIPHRFKEAFYTLTSAKCKFCNTVIHGRGFKCIHCHFTCHEKCSTRVPPNCGLAEIPSKTNTLTKERRTSSFLKLSSGGSDTLKKGSSIDLNVIGNDVFGIDISQLPGGDDEIPHVVSLCVHAIERKGGMDMEGIYRIPGIKGEIEKLRLHFAYGRPNLDDEEWSDINVIGGTLKLWFRLLPDSLLTKELFKDFTSAISQSASEQDRIERMVGVLKRLPKRNHVILKYLISHLQRVAEKSKVNKMHADNLGAVFGPSLMKSPLEDDIAAIGQQCLVIEFMIKHFHECFENPS